MNAREELLQLLRDNGLDNTDIEAATLTLGRSYMGNQQFFHLPTGHTPEQWYTFERAIDFNYDNGYGGQELFGTLWFKNGNWAERGEYDGSEWWEYRQRPLIPDELKGETQ